MAQESVEDLLKSYISFPGNPKMNENLRQRIALQMMSNRKGYPKNLGEGLTAIGDAIGDNRMANKLEQADVAAQGRAQEAERAVTAPAAAAPAPRVISETEPTEPPPAEVQPQPQQPQPVKYAVSPPQTAGGSEFLSSTPPGLQPPANIFAPQIPPQLGGSSPMAREPNPARYTSPAPIGMPGGLNPAMQADAFLPEPQLPPNAPVVAQGGDEPIPGGQVPSSPLNAPAGPAGASGGLPPGVAGPGTRESIARTLQQQQNPAQVVPQPNPTLAGPSAVAPSGSDPASGPTGLEQRFADAGLPRRVATDAITAAPPPAAVNRAPPPPAGARFLQGGPQGVPGYVMEEPRETPPPPQIPMSDAERKIIRRMNAEPGNPYTQQLLAPRLAEEQGKRKFQQEILNKQYESREKVRELLTVERQKQLAGSAEGRDKHDKAQVELQKAKNELSLFTQFAGMDPSKVFETLQKSKEMADKGRASLLNAHEARKAITAGAITGFGADARVDIAKFFNAIGLVDKGDVIANTEVFKAAIIPTVSAVLAATVGTTQLSNSDREFAANAAGGNIKLEGDSIRRIMDIIGKGSRYMIEQHQNKVDAFFQDSPKGQAMFGVTMPDIPKGAPAMPVWVPVPNRAAAERLGIGTYFVYPDGQRGVVE